MNPVILALVASATVSSPAPTARPLEARRLDVSARVKLPSDNREAVAATIQGRLQSLTRCTKGEALPDDLVVELSYRFTPPMVRVARANRDTSKSKTFANCLIGEILVDWNWDFEIRATITVRLIPVPAQQRHRRKITCTKSNIGCPGPAVYIGPALWTTLVKRGLPKRRLGAARYVFFGDRFLNVGLCSKAELGRLAKEPRFAALVDDLASGASRAPTEEELEWLEALSPFDLNDTTIEIFERGGRRLGAVFVNRRLVALDLVSGPILDGPSSEPPPTSKRKGR